MAVLATQPVPAGPGKHLLQCWCPRGLNLLPGKEALEEPPSVAPWVTTTYNAPVNSSGRGDASNTQRRRSSSCAPYIPAVLGTPHLHVSESPEAQQRATDVVAGQQSDQEKNKWSGLEQTCPSNADVYEYIAVVVEGDGELYAHCPDVKATGGSGDTMEEVKRNLKENLLLYFEDVVCGNVPFPPARFKTLDDYKDIEEEPMFTEEGVSFLCLLPCRITLEELKAWMAREHVSCAPPYWLDSSQLAD